MIILMSPSEIGSSFGSTSWDCCELSLDRNGTLRARRNAHRNERLTRVGVESKMPMEPHFEREAVDRCFVAFSRYLTETRCVLSIGYTFPGRSVAPEEAPESLFCSGFRSKSFAEERRGEPTAGRGILRGWHTVHWKSIGLTGNCRESCRSRLVN